MVLPRLALPMAWAPLASSCDFVRVAGLPVCVVEILRCDRTFAPVRALIVVRR